jgi:hypothetical protein
MNTVKNITTYFFGRGDLGVENYRDTVVHLVQSYEVMRYNVSLKVQASSQGISGQ